MAAQTFPMQEQTNNPPVQGFAPVAEAPVPEVEEFGDPLGGFGNVLEQPQDSQVFMENGMAEQVAEIYNLAGLGTLYQPVTPDSVLRDMTGNYTQGQISQFAQDVLKEDESIQKDLIMSAISDPKVGVEHRIQLAETINSMNAVPDVNAIIRQAMHNANLLENSGDTEEDEDDQEAGAIAAEALPREVVAETPMPVGEEVVRDTYTKMLNQYMTEASDGGGLDFLATMIPFRTQYPVMKIYNALGLNEDGVVAAGGNNVFLGNALQRLREHISGLSYEDKISALHTVMGILKPNSGVFADGNDFVTQHVLSEIFYKDIYNEEYEDTTLGAAVIDALPAYAGAGVKARKAELTGSRANVSFNQFMDNAGSVFDIIGVGSLAKATISLGTKWLPKSLSRMRKVAPDMATDSTLRALDDPAVLAKFPGMTKEDIVATFLPSADRAIQEGGVEGFGSLISKQLDIRDRLLRIAERSNYSAAERADAFAEIQKHYGDIATAPTSTLHLNESVFQAGETGVRIEGIFGRTKTKPFSSLGQAAKAGVDQVKNVFGADAPVELVWRNPATNKIEPIPAGMKASTKGEFFLRATDELAYEAAPTTYHSLVFGDKDVANLGVAPSLWKALRGPTLMGRDLSDTLSLAARQRTEWNKLTSGLVADVATLSSSEQRLLSKVLKEGEKINPATGTGKVFTPSELSALGMSEAGQRGYYAYRTATDIMYEVTNKQTRTQMLRNGVQDIHGPKGRVGYGQVHGSATDVLNTLPRGTHSVPAWDATSGTFVKLDRKAIDALYGDGGKLAKLEQPMLGKGGNEATHVIMDKAGAVSARALPRQVVTKIEGYYPHMWKGNYVVFGTTSSGNRVAIGLAANEADAKRAAQRLEATRVRRAAKGKANNFAQFGFDFDRSLSQDLGRRGAMMEGLYVNMGGPVYGHRNGGTLRNFSKAAGDILVDPVEALLRGMEIVGTKATKGEVVNLMRQRAYQYAKDADILRDPRVVPATADDLVKRADRVKEYEKAKAYLETAENFTNVHDSVDAAISRFFESASSLVARLSGSNAIATTLANRAAKGGDPMGTLMGFLHRTTIASAPVAQAALQSAQSLMMLGVAPKAYAKAVHQTAAVSTLVGLRSNALHGGKYLALTEAQFQSQVSKYAKLLGMDQKELVQVVDKIMESGIVSSVGYHTQMRNAMRSAAEERMLRNAKGLNNNPLASLAGRSARWVDAQTFGRLSRVGFEAGESVNQIATFLTLYNRDKAAGVANLASNDYLRKITGSVAELTGNMIPEFSFSYQRGWLKAAMQFVSFQHKMMLLLLPAGVGGAKTITGAQKASMVLAQFLLFGRRGAPHMDAIYRVVDNKITENAADEEERNAMYAAWTDPMTRGVMDGLIADYTTNLVIKELFGEQPNYAVSERFAPGGGGEFLVDRLFAIASNPTQAIFGLAGEKTSKLYSFSKRVGDITLANIRGYDDVPLDERMDEILKEGGAHLLSGYNKYLATQMAQRMDGWVSAGGRVTEGYSGALEGVLYSQFGITTKDRESLYAAQDKYIEEKLTNPLSRKKDLDELSDQYYKDLLESAVRFDKEAVDDVVWSTLLDRWVRERGLLFSQLDPPDAEYIRDTVAQRLERAAMGSNDSAETVLIERLTKDIRDGGFGAKGPEVAVYLENAEFVRNNPKLKELVYQAWYEATTDEGEL